MRRQVLATSRNHHHVGTRMPSETALEVPGYDLIIPKATATVAKISDLKRVQYGRCSRAERAGIAGGPV